MQRREQLVATVRRAASPELPGTQAGFLDALIVVLIRLAIREGLDELVGLRSVS